MCIDPTNPISPEWTMKSLANRDPFPSYEILRQRGPIVWDPGMNCWLVLDYEHCKTIESNEKDYRIVPADLPDWMIEIRGGRTGLSTLTGEDHTRMRRVYLKTFTASMMPVYRDKFVIPIINYNISKFEDQGHAELFSQLVEVIPIRVAMALCGLPWQDDSFVARLLEVNQAVVDWIGLGHPNHEVILRRAKKGAEDFSKMILPYILERRDGTGDDLVSQIWSRASAEYGEIGPDDMVAITKDVIAAAGHTTSHAMANTIYLYLSDPELRRAVSEDQKGSLNALVEEALRTLGSPQWRFRKANSDIEIGGVTIRRDDLICNLHAAANRDPGHYTCPHAVDLERKPVNDHLAFNVGPRTCVGMPLARLEIRECMKILIERFPDLKLNANCEAPSYRGFSHRSYAPLHVTF